MIGAARRKVSGVSADRVAMIIAVLEKRAELRLAADDVFVNIAGGVKVAEPAIDLAIALAIASAHTNRPLPAGTLADRRTGPRRRGPQRPATRTAPPRSQPRWAWATPSSRTSGGNIPKLGGMALHEVRRLSQAMADL